MKLFSTSNIYIRENKQTDKRKTKSRDVWRLVNQRLIMIIPLSPIGFTTPTRNRIDPRVSVHFEISTTHYTFTIHSWHCFNLVHWMLKTHQTTFTVKHTPCKIYPKSRIVIQSHRIFTACYVLKFCRKLWITYCKFIIYHGRAYSWMFVTTLSLSLRND